jgi:archaellum biogenesis ATPase FlaH
MVPINQITKSITFIQNLEEMSYDITEILLEVALNTITLTLYNFYFHRKIMKKLTFMENLGRNEVQYY